MRLQNLRDHVGFKLLAERINEFTNGGPCVFVPSPGNWGDALINEGARQFFLNFGINTVTLKRAELITKLKEGKFEGFTVVVGGGGGWCKNWSTTPDFVREVLEFDTRVIVMPTTFELDLLPDSVNSRISYFSRANDQRAEVTFCPDMAFFMDLDIDANIDQRSWRLFAMRNDKEAAENSIKLANSIDISLLGNSYDSVRQFFEILARFDVVYTDRLHVAIARSMLGLPVNLADGNYGKAQAVYEASLANYRDTRMITWEEIGAILS